MTVTRRFGAEILVNTIVVGFQDNSAVAQLSDGRFVVSWNNTSPLGGDPSDGGIRAQIFASNGSRIGPELAVNTFTPGLQYESAITGLSGGRFMVTWTNQLTQQGAPVPDVQGQIFNADGTKVGTEFLIPTTTALSQDGSTITELADGRILVAWADQSQITGDTSDYAIRGQILTADGAKSGPEFLINTETDGAQGGARAAALQDGGFVVVWVDSAPSVAEGDGSSSAIKAQIFAANGAKIGTEFLVNTSVQGVQTRPAVTTLADGRFVVTWSDFGQNAGDTSSGAVRGQVFNADGIRSGTEFLVPTSTLGEQSESSIAALPDGRFVVSWTTFSSAPGDGFAPDIKAQVFNIDGSKSGPEFRVNGAAGNVQWDSQVATLADGRFVITWTDFNATGGDLFDSAVRAQIFDPRNAAVNLRGQAGADDLVGTFLDDTIQGRSGNDKLAGGNGADVLQGDAGDDNIAGDGGIDDIQGGTGNDRLYGGAQGDWIEGGSGDDTLDGGIEADELIGGVGNDTYILRDNDLVTEVAGEGTDRASSSASFAVATGVSIELLTTTNSAGTTRIDITGNEVSQTLVGNAGTNLLDGKGGNDTMTGGAGADSFQFSTALGAGNIDTITDFNVAADTIRLENAVFTGLAAGSLSSAAFRRNDTGIAGDSSDRIIYETDTGNLYFDADGTGAGGRVRFAVLDMELVLTNLDFLVF